MKTKTTKKRKKGLNFNKLEIGALCKFIAFAREFPAAQQSGKIVLTKEHKKGWKMACEALGDDVLPLYFSFSIYKSQKLNKKAQKIAEHLTGFIFSARSGPGNSKEKACNES